MENERIKDAVRARYSRMAEQSRGSCCSGCDCGTSPLSKTKDIGYSGDELGCIPEEAVMGLGCGNPTAIAELKAGETVLDLGSGAGLDAFLAAGRVGPGGKVIGVDMTREMIDKANAIAKSNGYENVEFRLGEIEKLPVDDCSVDT
ncbi:MAG: methyltransferase domain-containing protein, partial [Dehalococcoidia bacterium]|nr:methyltransferase domain-containing protein [Dehalococcoidia bacterium]